MTITGNFEPFQYFLFERNFLKNENLFQQTGRSGLKAQHYHTKQPCQKPIVRQIEWRVHIGHITKNGVLPVTTLFF